MTGAVIKNEKSSNTIGIGTGTAVTGLGLTMLFKKLEIEFLHFRNMLHDIWEGPTVSSLIPSFIWYYLNMWIKVSILCEWKR